MYFKKFVVSVMVDGKHLREEDGEVSIPFGTEYSVFFKNLNTKDAVVKLSIDGDDMFDNKKLIVKKGESAVVHGRIDGLNASKKFKFIERTGRIEEHRGISPEDGLIKVDYWFEKTYDMPYTITVSGTYDYPLPRPTYYGNQTGKPVRGGISSMSSNSSRGSVASASCYSVAKSSSYEAPGITVGGGQINQGFGVDNTWKVVYETDSNVIVLKLKGYGNKIKIKEIHTTREKIECPTCGKKNKTSNKFCLECGTGLK